MLENTNNIENIIQTDYNIVWLPQPNIGQIVLSSHLPPAELSVTAMVLAFSGQNLLQTRLVKRGWDLVGGHIEPGETPEEAVRREAYEEAGALLGPLHLLGFQRLRLPGMRPENYRYPFPESYQIFYWARVIDLEEITPDQEKSARSLFSPTEAEQLPWVQAHQALYKAAIDAMRADIS